MRNYNQYISPLRQSAKQRRSSEIAENKFSNRDPLAQTNIRYINPKSSTFSQEMRMNRYLMSKSSLNNIRNIDDYSSTVNEVNNIQDYTSSMYEIKRAA